MQLAGAAEYKHVTDTMMCLTSTNFNLIMYTCLFPFSLWAPLELYQVPGTTFLH